MMTIQLMNKIAGVGTDIFDKSLYAVTDKADSPVAMMVRSASLHEIAFGEQLLAIARCGAGVNNIPVDQCAEQGIVVFNTPGANANGVKELAVAALILAARDIVGGIEWVHTLKGQTGIAAAVEKGKGAFVGNELMGRTLGVIGLGAIGGMVANAAVGLGMNVLGCDPYITVKAAWGLSRAVDRAQSYEQLYQSADYLSLHVPATDDTRHMINKAAIAQMKDGVRIINLSRADLVNLADMKEALAVGKVAAYITDFPTDESVGVKGIVNIPHLGASTAESEDNCAVMAAMQLDDYLRYGNIKNSVNFPNVELPPSKFPRLGVMHKNIPNMLSHITSMISAANINIEHLANGSKGEYAYTLIDIDRPITDELKGQIENRAGMIKIRVIL